MKNFLRLFRFAQGIFILISICLLAACGMQGVRESQPMGVLPKAMLKSLANGTLSSVLEVYASDATKVYQESLLVDNESGEVFSSSFNLEPATTYHFLITFYFKAEGIPELPIAFVAKIITTQAEGALEVSWDESEIVFLDEAVDPNLAASFAVSLPPLDQDHDSESNFLEFQNGTNPTDAKSFSSNFYVEENASGVQRCLQGGSVDLQWDIKNPEDVEKLTLIQSGSAQPIPLSLDVTNTLDEVGHGTATLSCDSEKSDFELQVLRSGKTVDSKKLKISPVVLSNINSGDVVLPDHQFTFDDGGLSETLNWRFEFHEPDFNEDVVKEGAGSIAQGIALKPRRDYEITVKLRDSKNQVISEKFLDIATGDSRLAGWWRFNEGQGNTVRDDSGHNHPVSFFGPIDWLPDPWPGIYFSNDGDYGRASGAVHGGSDELSVEVLMSYDGSDSYAIVSQNGEYLLRVTAGKYQVVMRDQGICGTYGFIGGQMTNKTYSSLSSATGEHHVVFVYDANGLHLFIDGEPDFAFGPDGPELVLPLNNNCLFDFGVNFIAAPDNQDTIGQSHMLVSEIAVYNKALSVQEIQENCFKVAPSICNAP